MILITHDVMLRNCSVSSKRVIVIGQLMYSSYIIYVIVVMFLVYKYIRDIEVKAAKYAFISFSPTQRAERTRSRKVMIQGVMYAIAMMLVFLPFFVYMVVQTYVIDIQVAIFSPLQGIYNVMIYSGILQKWFYNNDNYCSCCSFSKMEMAVENDEEAKDEKGDGGLSPPLANQQADVQSSLQLEYRGINSQSTAAAITTASYNADGGSSQPIKSNNVEYLIGVEEEEEEEAFLQSSTNGGVSLLHADIAAESDDLNTRSDECGNVDEEEKEELTSQIPDDIFPPLSKRSNG